MGTVIVNDFSDLYVYRTGYETAMRIFHLSKEWPKVERYALTDQIRRSSRSVCSNIAETWCRRRYERHFINKLFEAEAKGAETMNWLRFARDWGYLEEGDHTDLLDQYQRIRAGLVKVMRAPEKWCGPSTLNDPLADYSAN